MDKNTEERIMKFVADTQAIPADEFCVSWLSLANNARDAKVAFDIKQKAYNELSPKDRKLVFLQMSWPGLFKEKKSAGIIAPAPPNIVLDTSRFGAASLLRHRADGVGDTSDMAKLIGSLSEMFPTHSLESVIQLLTRITSVTPGMDRSMPWGNGDHISAVAYQQWAFENKGIQEVVGPFKLWKLLAKMGLGWVRKPTDEKFRDVLIYSRAGMDLYCVDKFQVHSSIDYKAPIEASETYVNSFLKNMYYKGRPVCYRAIPMSHYTIANAFLTKYSLDSTKEGVASASMIKGQVNNPMFNLPFFGDDTLVAFEKLLKRVGEGAIRAKAADDIYEHLARLVPHVVQDVASVYAELMESAEIAATNTMAAVERLIEIKDQSVPRRAVAMEKYFDATGKADKAVLMLKEARKLRSPKDTCAIVNHNTCSVRGAYFTEWVDTYEKGFNIIDYIKDSVSLQPDHGDKNPTKFVVFGVAYGHMSEAFKKLPVKDPTKNLRFYDIKKPVGSTEQFDDADIFQYATTGAWVIDDSDSHKLPKVLQDKHKGWTGDHWKINNLMAMESPVIISKVSLKSFSTTDHMILWQRLLFNDRAGQYSVELVKFGKLHTTEAFLCLVKDGNAAETTEKTLNANIMTVSRCVEIANKIIMYWQQVGLRVDDHEWGTKTKCLPIGKVWMALILALPTVWSWYFTNLNAPRSVDPIQAMEDEEAAVDYASYDQDHHNKYAEMVDSEWSVKKKE